MAVCITRTRTQAPLDKWDGRIRLNAKGQVNDSTYVQGCLDAEMNLETSDDTNVIFDQLFVNHDFGDAVTVRLGRQPVVIGDQSGWLYGFPYGYDGAQAMFHRPRQSDCRLWPLQ